MNNNNTYRRSLNVITNPVEVIKHIIMMFITIVVLLVFLTIEVRKGGSIRGAPAEKCLRYSELAEKSHIIVEQRLPDFEYHRKAFLWYKGFADTNREKHNRVLQINLSKALFITGDIELFKKSYQEMKI